ncbi:MAG: hypothetical protein JRJ39_00365 [Deltaproteobacteria bacterium]|nr:hypothetical protein [Deltaproteobacteria bacterium]MBW1845561.1 hypothetical protein [Deltaproteobacteria bacterium]
MYNMMFGVNQFAPLLVGMIGLDHKNVPRFRDAYIGERDIDGDPLAKVIVIHTRTGGGNREAYQELNETLKNEHYIFDRDDDFDSTYADWFYRVPEKWKDFIEAISSVGDHRPPKEKWQSLFNKIKENKVEDQEVLRAMEAFRKIFISLGIIK